MELHEIKKLLVMSELEQKKYFKLYIKENEEKIKELKGKIKFISLIMSQGLPQIPEENADITYTSRVAEIRKECVCE